MTEESQELQGSPALEQVPSEPILFRSSTVTDVDFSQRIIEFVAAPYDEEAVVMWRGQAWRELFLRGAWNGIEKRPTRIKVNREHNKLHTVGKIISWWPSREEGLVGAARIAKTVLGDETLALAQDECLGASVGYAALPRDVELDKRSQPGLRRVKRAFMDHLALTVEPTWESAAVLSVRSPLASGVLSREEIQAIETPELDELRAFMQSRRK